MDLRFKAPDPFSHPKDVAAHNSRGECNRRKGNADQAITDFTVAIQLAPKIASVHKNRALAYSKKGESAKAEGDLVQARKLG